MDLEVVESLNGGDLLKKGNDLSIVESWENMPYLGMFGGNKEASTPVTRIATEQAFDWWGNAFLEPDIQFNSLTERTLETVALNSSGRLEIEEAIKKDLEFMKPFAEVKVTTSIPYPDVLRIALIVKRPDNLEEQEFIYIWEKGRVTIRDTNYVTNTNPVPDESLQYELQFYL